MRFWHLLGLFSKISDLHSRYFHRGSTPPGPSRPHEQNIARLFDTAIIYREVKIGSKSNSNRSRCMTSAHLLTPSNNKVHITLKKQVRSKVGRPSVRERQRYMCHERRSPVGPITSINLYKLIYFYFF